MPSIPYRFCPKCNTTRKTSFSVDYGDREDFILSIFCLDCYDWSQPRMVEIYNREGYLIRSMDVREYNEYSQNCHRDDLKYE